MTPPRVELIGDGGGVPGAADHRHAAVDDTFGLAEMLVDDREDLARTQNSGVVTESPGRTL
jgi:hypothetical protein